MLDVRRHLIRGVIFALLALALQYMLFRNVARRAGVSSSKHTTALARLRSLATQMSSSTMTEFKATNGVHGAAVNNDMNGTTGEGMTLDALPKSHVFTEQLPTDQRFPTPADSHKASHEDLGPSLVKGALFTYVRPLQKDEPELVSVSARAMTDIGLKPAEAETQAFKDLVSGNKIWWDESQPDDKDGIYPWAQCYGGWQFGSWAGQLGDGRAISLFESTNPHTGVRYELQLKGAGKTPYSRFADGKAVVRSSVREYVVSESLNALGIPTTRALALTITPKTQVVRERLEPGAIVCRFAQSWLRIGTFDLLRARGDRKLIRRLADYVAEHVFGGWDKLPSDNLPEEAEEEAKKAGEGEGEEGENGESEANKTKIERPLHLNRYAQLYRHICRVNARTVAAWQAYGFTNGVLNTDNTSLMGLSLDFGPFAFIDNFDPAFTPNHDDHMLRYSYRNQPSIIWWNLVRLGETLGELLGAGDKWNDTEFVEQGVDKDWAPEVITRAEGVIRGAGSEYQQVFLKEYKRLMTRRLGLKTTKDTDFKELYSELLDTMESLELDFHHFFRRLSGTSLGEIASDEARVKLASRFFHAEGVTGAGYDEEAARKRIAAWLEKWQARVAEDWGSDKDEERQKGMKAVNPNFVPRGWVLDEVIRRVEKEGDRKVMDVVMRMALNPFEDSWEGKDEEEARWCADPPSKERGIMCSCSS